MCEKILFSPIKRNDIFLNELLFELMYTHLCIQRRGGGHGAHSHSLVIKTWPVNDDSYRTPSMKFLDPLLIKHSKARVKANVNRP